MDLYFDVRQHSKNNKCIYDYLMIMLFLTKTPRIN